MIYINDTVIKRHTKIKADANPYDLAFETYFEQRLERAWRDSMQGQRKVLTLWLRQQHRCPLCRQTITKETGWNIHHIMERVKGGSDELSNLVLLYPNCHRQLHLI
ncbi:HNH endonuclease [Pseudoalteromonas luteoviolacea]|uniref:HNH endonuclease n=1 Tax=Pseudoalteromonas luteoviolacea TaxID=43657 RepID=UPI001F475940|nr:HNH endonuclease signature motif containing protein [Pseudoalteromonas luteoviolacea]MCF6438426.1 HNH endonuclease [Pseudoalteromonas luteoviolacea]